MYIGYELLKSWIRLRRSVEMPSKALSYAMQITEGLWQCYLKGKESPASDRVFEVEVSVQSGVHGGRDLIWEFPLPWEHSKWL